MPPTIVFEPEITSFIKLFTKRVQLQGRARPGRLRRRPGGKSCIYDGGERLIRDGEGNVELSGYPSRFLN